MLRTLLARHSTRLLVAGSGNGTTNIKSNLHKYREFSTTGVDLVSAFEDLFNLILENKAEMFAN